MIPDDLFTLIGHEPGVDVLIHATVFQCIPEKNAGTLNVVLLKNYISLPSSAPGDNNL